MITNSDILILFVILGASLILLVLDSAGSGLFHRWLSNRKGQ